MSTVTLPVQVLGESERGEGGAHGRRLVPVGGADGDALGGERRGPGAAFVGRGARAGEQACDDLRDGRDRLRVGTRREPGRQLQQAPAAMRGLVDDRSAGRSRPAEAQGQAPRRARAAAEP